MLVNVIIDRDKNSFLRQISPFLLVHAVADNIRVFPAGQHRVQLGIRIRLLRGQLDKFNVYACIILNMFDSNWRQMSPFSSRDTHYLTVIVGAFLFPGALCCSFPLCCLLPGRKEMNFRRIR